MYENFFGLKQLPFSIVPNPRFLFPSQRHKEALAHLFYSFQGNNGFVLLTGEVGTGKTMICRCLTEQIPGFVDFALIFNPRLSSYELIASICDELKIAYHPETTSIKLLYDALNHHLVNSHANGRSTIVIIDEAQNLSVELLEQIRLLTNLETSTKKLLTIILIGQPELIKILERQDLRQLAQRITARYHIAPLVAADIPLYIQHRLSLAGCTVSLFTPSAIRLIHRCSNGIPRIINKICDRALLGAYAKEQRRITRQIVHQAAMELGHPPTPLLSKNLQWILLTGVCLAVAMHIPEFLPSPWLNRLMSMESPPWMANLVTNRAQKPPTPPPSMQPKDPATLTSLPILATGVPKSNSTPLPANPGEANTKSKPNNPDGKAELVHSRLKSTDQKSQPGDADLKLQPDESIVKLKLDVDVVKIVGPSTQSPSPAVSVPASSDLNEMSASSPSLVRTPDEKVPLEKSGRPLDHTPLEKIFYDENNKTSIDSAFATLLGLWRGSKTLKGASYDCDNVISLNLTCLYLHGNWQRMQLLNAPAIIELVDASPPRFAVISAINKQDVTFAFSNQRITLPITQLQRARLTPGTMLWPITHNQNELLKEGNISPDVVRLREELERIQGKAIPTDIPELFDSTLKQAVQIFQSSTFLQPDGIAGPLTRITLDAVTGKTEKTMPRLH